MEEHSELNSLLVKTKMFRGEEKYFLSPTYNRNNIPVLLDNYLTYLYKHGKNKNMEEEMFKYLSIKYPLVLFNIQFGVGVNMDYLIDDYFEYIKGKNIVSEDIITTMYEKYKNKTKPTYNPYK